MTAVTRRNILLVALAVLSVYFPSISTQINSVDDVHILAAYENGSRTIAQILSPAGKFYYRPFIEFSYYWDDLLWGLDPRLMHLENILLHLSNAVLVYLLATRLFRITYPTASPRFALLASLLFAIHPVQTEAVSWIAGRTDPLAAFFVILTMIFFFRVKETGKNVDVIFTAAMAACSLLTKETAISVLPSLLLLEITIAQFRTDTRRVAWTVYLSACLVVAGLAAGFLLFRTSNAFGTFLSRDFNWEKLGFSCFKDTGFYVTKFLFPYPLNFAVDSVSNWYVPVGILFFLLVLYLCYKKSILGWMLGSGLLFLLPAIAAGFTGMSWTPVAERYLYLPSVFIVLAVSELLNQFLSDCKRQGLRHYLLYAVFSLLALLAFDRNMVWRSNETLYRDAVKKSPLFGDAHLELGVALSQQGRLNEAIPHFLVAEQKSERQEIRELARTNLLFCNLQNKNMAEKRNVISLFVKGREHVDPDVIRMWRSIDQDILSGERNSRRRTELMEEVIYLNDRLYHQTRDVACVYSNGQLFLALQKREKALELFRQAVAEAPPDSYYLNSARRMAAQLERY